MSNSNELLIEAVKDVQLATGCDEHQAKAVVHAIAAYIARCNAEIINRHGPLHEFAEEHGL